MAILLVNGLAKPKNKLLLTAVKALELMLLSAGLFSTLIMVKNKGNIIPYSSCELVFTSLIEFLNSIKCFFSSLSPLHICITINFIVVLIALSSTIHPHHHDTTNTDHDEIKVNNIDLCFIDNLKSPLPPQDVNLDDIPPPAAPPPPLLPKPSRDISVIIPEPPVEESDTLDATWKSITGGGKQRSTRRKQLKKLETWDVPPRASFNMRRLDSEEVMPSSPKWKELRKSETFNDAVSATRRGGMVRRIPSMSLEDFNKKVEAFIKKGTNNMKLQRR